MVRDLTLLPSRLVTNLRLGKPWSVAELEEHMEAQRQDGNDLHSLWWTCVKERNRLATEKLERARVNAGYGDYENQHRDEAVQKTMKAIQDLMKKQGGMVTDSEGEEYLDEYTYSVSTCPTSRCWF